MVLIADMTGAAVKLQDLKDIFTALGRDIGVEIRVQSEEIFTPCSARILLTLAIMPTLSLPTIVNTIRILLSSFPIKQIITTMSNTVVIIVPYFQQSCVYTLQIIIQKNLYIVILQRRHRFLLF